MCARARRREPLADHIQRVGDYLLDLEGVRSTSMASEALFSAMWIKPKHTVSPFYPYVG
jgi:hypothetical protein